jgi:hypothetical protein
MKRGRIQRSWLGREFEKEQLGFEFQKRDHYEPMYIELSGYLSFLSMTLCCVSNKLNGTAISCIPYHYDSQANKDTFFGRRSRWIMKVRGCKVQSVL